MDFNYSYSSDLSARSFTIIEIEITTLKSIKNNKGKRKIDLKDSKKESFNRR